MKKSFIMLLCILIVFMCSGCINKISGNSEYFEYPYYILTLSESEAALGDIDDTNMDAIFIPEFIIDYKVIELGYYDGKVMNKTGVYTIDDNNGLTKIYFPSTIAAIKKKYMECDDHYHTHEHKLAVMYCGKVLNLLSICGTDCINYYVPSTEYEEYLNVFTGNKEHIKSANVVYDLNYEGREYYYVDYVGSDGLIENIPPEPVRDNYTFDGWYTEKDFQHKWDFLTDNVIIQEGQNEVRLYAKWIEKRLNED